MNTRIPLAALVVTTALAGLTPPAPAQAAADPAYGFECAPRLVAGRTEFPVASRRTREHGTVVIEVQIARDGSVHAARVEESSGHHRLDRAAVESALTAWRFEMAHCASAVPAASKLVAVQFVAAAATTFSAMPVPGYRKRIQQLAAKGCEISAGRDAVSSCTRYEHGTRSRMAAR